MFTETQFEVNLNSFQVNKQIVSPRDGGGNESIIPLQYPPEILFVYYCVYY